MAAARKTGKRSSRQVAKRRSGLSEHSQQREQATGRGKRLVLDLLLLSATAFVFTLSFPSFIDDGGWWPLAYVALAPAIYVVNRSSVKRSIWYGLFCGMLTYMLHNYWIGSFHVLATLIVPGIYGIYYVVLFPVLAFVGRRFGRYGYLAQAVAWISYEYLRTLGFLGYAYGIIGYTQYHHPALVRLSSLTGIWGISLLVIIPSLLIAQAVSRAELPSSVASDSSVTDSESLPRNTVSRFIRPYATDITVYVAAFVALLVVGGVFLRIDYSDSDNWRVALVQQNVDPHRGGISAYRESLDRSIRQSNAALERDDSIEAVIWSETSFVPPIEYHSRFRENPDTLELVNRLREFMGQQSVPYIIGNADARRERRPDGSVERVDYNASLLYENGSIQDVYRKVHLVPFTEHFPYRDSLPWAYNLLQDFDTYFWGKGNEYTVFETDNGVSFATPICFEDTFGYLSRNFIREGADVIVNLTNDRWADSVSAAMQHLAMAVFRSGENRRTMVRGTNGGMTAVIDPNGVITDMAEPLVEGHMIADAPVYAESSTVYTRFGDWFAYLAVSVTIVLLGSVVVQKMRARPAG